MVIVGDHFIKLTWAIMYHNIIVTHCAILLHYILKEDKACTVAVLKRPPLCVQANPIQRYIPGYTCADSVPHSQCFECFT